MASPQSKSAQNLLEVKEIKNGVVLLVKGGLRKVVTVTGVNIDLKSEEEQEVILNTFQDFLNSLSFTTQIFIHSRKLNVDNYLEKVNARLEEETNELLRNQITEYREFIKSFVEQNAIMTKSYFVIIPFSSSKLAAPSSGAKKSGGGGGLLSRFGKHRAGEPTADPGAEIREKSFTELVEQLDQRASQVINGLNRIGLRAVALNDEELIELYYNTYNPETTEKDRLEIATPEHFEGAEGAKTATEVQESQNNGT
jgi:hypothetical protein